MTTFRSTTAPDTSRLLGLSFDDVARQTPHRLDSVAHAQERGWRDVRSSDCFKRGAERLAQTSCVDPTGRAEDPRDE